MSLNALTHDVRPQTPLTTTPSLSRFTVLLSAHQNGIGALMRLCERRFAFLPTYDADAVRHVLRGFSEGRETLSVSAWQFARALGFVSIDIDNDIDRAVLRARGMV